MSAAEKLATLGWTQNEPRSAYDAAIFGVLAALVDEVETLRQQVGHIGFVQTGGDPE